MNKAIVSLLAHVLLAVIGGMLRRHVSLLVAIAALFIASGHVYDWWAAGRAVTVVSPKAGTFPMEKGRLVQIEKSAEHGAATGGGFPAAPDSRPISTLAYHYEKGERIATLMIPDFMRRYAVFWGTSSTVLEQGVGMYVSRWTAVPNVRGGHTVLSGHRDTVFSELGRLDKGERLVVKYDGRKFIYRIQKIWITTADDRSVIVPKKKPTLTLTTCYPFGYLGNAPKRYIVQAVLAGS